jgi:hypothetical protein
MRRPLYITELAAQPFPLGLIGHLMLPHQEFLRTICFADNERGDAANASAAYAFKIVGPVNRLLSRNRKNLRLSSINVDHSRHHTVEVRYQVSSGLQWEDGAVGLSLFLASKKAIAMERKADEDGEDYAVVAPRRGVQQTKRPKNRPRRKAKPKKKSCLA